MACDQLTPADNSFIRRLTRDVLHALLRVDGSISGATLNRFPASVLQVVIEPEAYAALSKVPHKAELWPFSEGKRMKQPMKQPRPSVWWAWCRLGSLCTYEPIPFPPPCYDERVDDHLERVRSRVCDILQVVARGESDHLAAAKLEVLIIRHEGDCEL